MRVSAVLLIATTAGVLLTSPASADSEYEKFNDRFGIYFGGFWASVDSKININPDVAPPAPPIDVEDVLGVEDSKGTAWGGAWWRISRRNFLGFEAFTLNRDGGVNGTFDPPIQIGDTFIEDGTITTIYDTSIARLTYGFSLIRDERMDLQLKAGLHLAKLEAGIQLSGKVCDPTTTPSAPPGCPVDTAGREAEDVTVPLPHLGASFTYAMTPSVDIAVQVIGFAIELDSIDGSIVEVDAEVTWKPWRHFGFGAGFRYFRADVESNGSDLNGQFEFDYLGPVVFVLTTF